MKNIFCHVEIPTLDLGKCRDFYGRLFTWKFKDWGPDYVTVRSGGKDADAGLMLAKPENFKPGILTYVLVNSIEQTLAKVEPAGGKIAVPKTEIPTMGWFAVIADAEENHLGIFETLKQPKQQLKPKKKPKKAKPKKKRRIKR